MGGGGSDNRGNLIRKDIKFENALLEYERKYGRKAVLQPQILSSSRILLSKQMKKIKLCHSTFEAVNRVN